MSGDEATDAARIATGGLSRWGFAEPGALRDQLTAAALAGLKTTTASLLVEYEIDGEAVPVVGQVDVLVDSDERDVAIVETVGVRIARLADVDDRHAIDEGEGYVGRGRVPGGPRAVLERVPGQDPERAGRPGVGAHGRHADRPRAVPDRGAPGRRAALTRSAALAAGQALAARYGLRSGTPVVLKDGSNLLVHLAPAPVVLRIASFTALIRGDPLPWLEREVVLVTYLASVGAAVMPPSDSSRRGRTWWTAGR